MKRELKKQLKELQAAYPNSHLFPDEGLDEAYIRYFHDGLFGSGKEYELSVYDLDEIAWLNTLMGYQLPWKDALQLNRECWELNHEISVLELGAKHKKLVKTAAKNKKLQLDFSRWATETPKTICYSFEKN